MVTETVRTDIRVTANDQNMWATGDAFIVEWDEYIPIIGGEIVDFEVVSVTQPEVGRVTFEGDQLTWDAAGATIIAPRSVEIDYRVRDDSGEEMDLFVSLDLENTLQGLEVSEADSGSGIGSLTFDAVLIEDRLQDREVLTLEKFIDFDLDLDAAAALEETGVLGTLRAARDQAQANSNAASAAFTSAVTKTSEAGASFATAVEGWSLQTASDIATTIAAVATTARDAILEAGAVLSGALPPTTTSMIAALNDAVSAARARQDVLLQEIFELTEASELIERLFARAIESGAKETDPLPNQLAKAVETILKAVGFEQLDGPVSLVGQGLLYNFLPALIDNGFETLLRQKFNESQEWGALVTDLRRNITEVRAYEAEQGVGAQIEAALIDAARATIDAVAAAVASVPAEIAATANALAAQAGDALEAFDGEPASFTEVLGELGDVITSGAELVGAVGAVTAAGIELGVTQTTLDAATAIGEGNKLKFDLEVDAEASAQAGIIIDLRFDGGSVDSDLDYDLTSTSTYDVQADTFTIAPTATNATTGEEIAFTTISPNAQFYVGLAYFADLTLDIATEYFGKAIGFDLFDSEGPITTREYFSIGGIFDIIDVDTTNLADAGILPDLPLAALQLPEFNEDNQISIEFNNWVDDIITELSFGVPILRTEGKETEFDPEFYADEVNVLQNLRTILSDFASAQLGFSEDFKTLLEANGAPTEFGEADFFEVIEAVFDSITASGEISDDGFIPIIELAIGSETALFHIDTFLNDLSGLDLSTVGSLGFFTASGTSNEVAKIEIDVDTLATVVVAQAIGIPPEQGVEFNPLDLGWSLEDELEGTDLTPDQQALINSSVALGFGLEIADLKIDSGYAFDQKFALRIDDMEYLVAFEDGTTQRVSATDAEALVFTDASELEDVDGDGLIDYTLTLTPEAEFFNDTELKLALGYTLDILKADFQLGLGLPLSQIPNLGLTDIPVFDLNLALGPLFRASADLDLLTLDIFEDRFAYEAGTASVAGSFTLPPAERGSTEPDELDGSEGDDLILGLEGADDLKGLGGNDTLDGGEGPDTLTGGQGDDTYIWDDSRDRVVEEADGGMDRIEATANVALRGAEIETVELLGADDLRVIGGETAQAILGNEGANVLVGGGGGDTVTGGGGADVFAFTINDAPGLTVIMDFEAEDRIALDDRFFGLGDGQVEPRDVTEAQFRSALRSGLAEYVPATGILKIDTDGPDGPEAPREILQIEGGGRLSVDDFLLF